MSKATQWLERNIGLLKTTEWKSVCWGPELNAAQWGVHTNISRDPDSPRILILPSLLGEGRQRPLSHGPGIIACQWEKRAGQYEKNTKASEKDKTTFIFLTDSLTPVTSSCKVYCSNNFKKPPPIAKIQEIHPHQLKSKLQIGLWLELCQCSCCNNRLPV